MENEAKFEPTTPETEIPELEAGCENEPRQAKLLEEIGYSGINANLSALEQLKKPSVYVPQGRGVISVDHTPLHSEGFSKCAALIIQSVDSDVAAMFHIDGIDLNPWQCQTLAELPQGANYEVAFVRGSISRDVKNRVRKLNAYQNYVSEEELLDDIKVETGEQHWGLVYDPETRRIYVDTHLQQKVLVYELPSQSTK